MGFSCQVQVRFAHVDAAGIVFYPRYFEMLNAALEDWFAAATGVGFAELHVHRRLGVPTVKLDSQFFAPSRLGDTLTIAITPQPPGTTSCAITYTVHHANHPRMTAAATIVCMNLDTGRATAWPDDVRAGLERGCGEGALVAVVR